MKSFKNLIYFLIFFISNLNISHADGYAKPWQMWFQNTSSDIADLSIDTHNFIMYFMIFILGVVFVSLAYTCIKFRASNNPTPSTTTHNVLIEIIWILVPTLIILIIAVPSVKLIYKQEVLPKTEMTLKVIGRQWYWSYQYPDHGEFEFDSYMKSDEELLPGEPRLLEVDHEVVLPINTNIAIHITSSDVIHSFAIPSLGVKKDAVPGRLNETWVNINKPGTYYGQCSELCGVRHAFMPIKIRAVTKEEFKEWIKFAQDKYAFLNHKIYANNLIGN